MWFTLFPVIYLLVYMLPVIIFLTARYLLFCFWGRIWLFCLNWTAIVPASSVVGIPGGHHGVQHLSLGSNVTIGYTFCIWGSVPLFLIPRPPPHFRPDLHILRWLSQDLGCQKWINSAFVCLKNIFISLLHRHDDFTGIVFYVWNHVPQQNWKVYSVPEKLSACLPRIPWPFPSEGSQSLCPWL